VRDVQALLWAWTHALPVRLQRPEGDASRLPSMAPGALPPPPKPSLQQPPVTPAPAESAPDSSRCTSGAGPVKTPSLGGVQQVTWAAAAEDCLTETASESQDMYRAVNASALLAIVFACAMLALYVALALSERLEWRGRMSMLG